MGWAASRAVTRAPCPTVLHIKRAFGDFLEPESPEQESPASQLGSHVCNGIEQIWACSGPRHALRGAAHATAPPARSQQQCTQLQCIYFRARVALRSHPDSDSCGVKTRPCGPHATCCALTIQRAPGAHPHHACPISRSACCTRSLVLVLLASRSSSRAHVRRDGIRPGTPGNPCREALQLLQPATEIHDDEFHTHALYMCCTRCTQPSHTRPLGPLSWDSSILYMNLLLCYCFFSLVFPTPIRPLGPCNSPHFPHTPLPLGTALHTPACALFFLCFAPAQLPAPAMARMPRRFSS